uniref:Exostosin domain-containing protein n=1 Tax=Caenorhabditis japonica TaxID=281687 RepID=A0A8R1DM18_CAEJA
MVIKLYNFNRNYAPSVRVTAFFILVIFVITSVVIFNSSFSDQTPSWGPKTDSLGKNIEKIDEFDASCSGYSFGRILREQKRILASVHLELAESQVKIEEIRAVQEELQRLIPQKQLELSALEGEIEAAQRQLEELRETQNVRVFLPLSPLAMPKVQEKIPPSDSFSLDDVIDYSRCSISSFMPIHVEKPDGKLENEWAQVFRKVVPNLVETSEESCLTIRITSGVGVNVTVKNNENPANLIILNIGATPIEDPHLKGVIVQSSRLRRFDLALDADSISTTPETLTPLLPLYRENLMFLLLPNENYNVSVLEQSAGNFLLIKRCSPHSEDCYSPEILQLFRSSTFCFIVPSTNYLRSFSHALRAGCVPILLSSHQILPFEDLIDWRRASYRMPMARLPEAHFIVRSFEMADILEMRRMGRSFYERYLANREAVVKSLIAVLRHKLQIPTNEGRSAENRAIPLFNSSFTSPKGSVVNMQPNFDDEYLLGPLESRVASPSFSYNFTEFQMKGPSNGLTKNRSAPLMVRPK